MAVSSNHAYVQGGDDIVDALRAAVDQAASVVTDAARDIIEEQHARLQDAASQHPDWHDLAQDIQYGTDEEGNLAYGVPQGTKSYDQAMRTEYGTQTKAPVALIRMGVVNGVTQMGWSLQQAIYEGGVG